MPGPETGGVELTTQEQDAIRALARHLGESTNLADAFESAIRRVARQEIASLAGMMLQQTDEEGPTRSPERNMAVELQSRMWGEALAKFGGETAPGE